ncbi:DUF2526 family protein, partial [Klebsiella aerogenes]
MAHLDDVIARVDDTIAGGVIASMNELLIALSDDAELGPIERYTRSHVLR